MPPKKKNSVDSVPVQPVVPPKKVSVKTPVQTTPVLAPKTTKLNQPILLGVLVVLIVLGLGGGYYAYTLLQHKTPVSPTVNDDGTVNYGFDTNTDTTNTADVNYSVTDVNVAGVTIGTVTWQEKKEIASLGLVNTEMQYSETNEKNATYYQVGTIKTGSMSGAKVLLMTLTYDSPQGPSHYYFLQKDSVLTAIAKNSDVISADPGQDILNRSKFTVDTTNELPGLRFPEKLTGLQPRQTLVQAQGIRQFFPTDTLTKVYTDAKLGPVYTKPNTATPTNTNSDQGLVPSDNSSHGGFYLKAPDGTLRVFFLLPDIIPAQTDTQYGLTPAIPSITWSNGIVNTDTFSLTALGGCGSSNYLNVIDSTLVNRATDLRQVGTTSTGDKVYEMKDSNAKILKDYYDTTYFVAEGTDATKATYAEFIASHPLVFWVDPFDRLVQLSNMKYAPQAECGKPVIYLYPTTTSNVDVKLQPRGGLTYSEPAYQDGWHVTAEPNGHLLDRTSGLAYPYLFWEGRGGMYQTPDKGFVVTQHDVHAFLISKLAALGLNEQETKDFVEFWEPKMQGSPYYAVSFLGNATMDQIAPLSVSPKPQTVIRVLMDFRPLSAPITIQPQTIHTPERQGFTVVEWGGVLR